MGRALEVVTSFVTAPGAVLTAAAAAVGNSLQIRSADVRSKVWMLNAWSFNQVVGVTRIRSPRLHDAVNGMRWRQPAAQVIPHYPSAFGQAFPQFVIPQDTIVVEQSGSGVGGQIESNTMLLYYENLPGVAARLIDYPTLLKAGVNLTTVETSIVSVVTGQYGGGVLLNAAANAQNLKANTDYALIGGLTDTRGTVARITGVDFGSLGVGFPAEPTVQDYSANFFMHMSTGYGLALIPVLNAANAGGITVDVQTNQAGGTFIITLNLVELQPNIVPMALSGPTV
jgi:hypothetical protein